MHVLQIIDEDRARREHAMLARVIRAMQQRDMRVSIVVPDGLNLEATELDVSRLNVTTRLEAPMRTMPWLRKLRTMQLTAAVQRTPPDLVIAEGQHAWSLAVDASRALERPLAMSVWGMDQVSALPSARRSREIGAYLAASAPLAEALRNTVDPALVSLVRPGVPVPDRPHDILTAPNDMVSIAVLGRGRDLDGYRRLLSGLSRVVQEHRQVQVFLELNGPAEHDIWLAESKLGLQANLTVVDDAAAARGLLSQCDAVILPEATGRVRSVLLQAMAGGLAVLACHDDVLDMLEDGRTAEILTESEPSAWEAALRRLITQPGRYQALGRAAHEHVARHHRAEQHHDQLCTTLERVQRGGVLPFQASGA